MSPINYFSLAVRFVLLLKNSRKSKTIKSVAVIPRNTIISLKYVDE